MKKMIAAILMIGFFAVGCATDGYNTQRGAAIGAGIGALTGQAIGHTTQSTLIGAGVGTLMGSIIGNGVDRQAEEYGYRSRPYGGSQYYGGIRSYNNRYAVDERTCNRQPPPGRWVMAPGHWEGRRWIPAHEQWMPINPR